MDTVGGKCTTSSLLHTLNGRSRGSADPYPPPLCSGPHALPSVGLRLGVGVVERCDMECSHFPLGTKAEADGGVPNGDYLDRLMRRDSFEALWPLFAKAQHPAKELTESYSALTHLRPFLAGDGPYRVLHVGDGAHARTGAMFSLKTQAHSVSVDPQLNLSLVEKWRERFGIRRLDCRKARIQDVSDELNELPPIPTLVTFVHAHVDVDAVLAKLRWNVAFSLACCHPNQQLTRRETIHGSGTDMSVLSASRSYQVLVNHSGPQ